MGRQVSPGALCISPCGSAGLGRAEGASTLVSGILSALSCHPQLAQASLLPLESNQQENKIAVTKDDLFGSSRPSLDKASLRRAHSEDASK